ncbi:hypothetical protein [Halorubrum kocurii]|uniref:hypothetical protein n=1 Tax=Halorubrum kocurii TaxID=478441 RepID=UPI000A875095|nr:hypothetical protein [Halorubrum kocurii]
MTETPNHRFNTPSEGESEWHIPLNENFEKLDIDVEIRDTEANKSNYDPKKGTKYEATDSGAIYYGDGNSWILASRKINKLESKEITFGEAFNKGPGFAIVAPSEPQAYNKIQDAIDAGYRDIWLCEDVDENNIVIPPNPDGEFQTAGNPFRLRGMAQDGRPQINDLGDGSPVITVEKGNTTSRFFLQNFRIQGGLDTGPCIDLGRPDFDGGTADPAGRPARGWIENVSSRGGPWIIWAGRHKLIHCDNRNLGGEQQSLTVAEKEVWPSIYTQGATFAMYGGAWRTQKGEDNTLIQSGAFSISGGATFNNRDGENPNGATVTLLGATRGFLGGFSCEGGPIDLRLGLKGDNLNRGIDNLVFLAPSMGGSDGIEMEINQPVGGSTFFYPNMDVKIQQNDRAELLFFSSSNNSITVTGDYNTGIYNIAPDFDGQLQFGGVEGMDMRIQLPTADSKPDTPKKYSEVIASGEGWDPAETGNPAKVIYNGNSWEIEHEFSP